MNAAGIISAIFRPAGSQRDGREKRKHKFLIFLRGWRFEIDGGRDPVKLASRFSDKVRFFVHHKTAVEGDFQGRTRSVFDDLGKAICGLTPGQLQETQNGEMTGRDKLSKAIDSVILFVERN